MHGSSKNAKARHMDKNESKADIGSVVGYSHMESRNNRNYSFFGF